MLQAILYPVTMYKTLMFAFQKNPYIAKQRDLALTQIRIYVRAVLHTTWITPQIRAKHV